MPSRSTYQAVSERAGRLSIRLTILAVVVTTVGVTVAFAADDRKLFVLGIGVGVLAVLAVAVNGIASVGAWYSRRQEAAESEEGSISDIADDGYP